MAYSKEKREQALELCQKGFTDDQVSEKLDISKYTLGTWKKLLFETGSLEKKKVKKSQERLISTPLKRSRKFLTKANGNPIQQEILKVKRYKSSKNLRRRIKIRVRSQKHRLLLRARAIRMLRNPKRKRRSLKQYRIYINLNNQ